MNTTNFFQSNFDFTAGDIKAVNFAAVTVAIIGLSIITGGAAGAAFGGGWAGAGAGAVVGAITGSAVGAIGFPALGLGSATDGALYGAILGGIAGGIAGYMASPIPKFATKQDCMAVGFWSAAMGVSAAAMRGGAYGFIGGGISLVVSFGMAKSSYPGCVQYMSDKNIMNTAAL